MSTPRSPALQPSCSAGTRTTTGCHLIYAQQPNIVAHDAEDHCDGCGRRDPDVLLSAAALEDEPLIVHAGLCRTCRAGDLPARA